jgi:hypothetical protein
LRLLYFNLRFARRSDNFRSQDRELRPKYWQAETNNAFYTYAYPSSHYEPIPYRSDIADGEDAEAGRHDAYPRDRNGGLHNV